MEGNRIRCKRCKRVFTPKRDWQRFCSKKCREEYWRQVFHEKSELNKRLERIEKNLGIDK